MAKTWYLKKKDGYVVGKFEREETDVFSGSLYTCFSWIGDTKRPYEYKFHSHIIFKWDGCTHWFFDGEDMTYDNYYHLHKDSFECFFALMCMAWKLAAEYYTEAYKEGDLYVAEYSKEEYDSKLVDYILKDYMIEEENHG